MRGERQGGISTGKLCPCRGGASGSAPPFPVAAMKKKAKAFAPGDAGFSREDAERIWDEIMGRGDKRRFLTVAFDFQQKYLWESRCEKSLGRFVGADWNAPKYRMVGVMKRYGISVDLLVDLINHACTFMRVFDGWSVPDGRDVYDMEVRRLFDFKTRALAERLKSEVGGKYRIRYAETVKHGHESLVEV